MVFNGLTQINVEFSSRCSKSCWHCGRRERDRLAGVGDYGDMDFDLMKMIAAQVPAGIVIATHNNGESILHPRFGEGVVLFKERGCFVYAVTNGKHLMEKFDEIVGNLDSVSVSIIENDDEAEVQNQLRILRRFVVAKGDIKPFVTLRFVGRIENEEKYLALGLPIVRRTLHQPKGSVGYRKAAVIPECGMCWDFMTRLAIDRFGNVSPCVRFDPDGELRLGNLYDMRLDECWNGRKRTEMRILHAAGARKDIPYCGDKCEFWGVPTAD
jgi:radical SAM protein with 4Fe4S-binding SPASM domain